MAIYSYVAFNKKGKEEKGIIDAASLQAARSKLKNKGLYVRNISEDSERKDRELFPFLAKYFYRIPRKEVGLFFQTTRDLTWRGNSSGQIPFEHCGTNGQSEL